jgi:hypothetical protein
MSTSESTPFPGIAGWTIPELIAHQEHLRRLLVVSAGQDDPEKQELRAELEAIRTEIRRRNVLADASRAAATDRGEFTVAGEGMELFNAEDAAIGRTREALVQRLMGRYPASDSVASLHQWAEAGCAYERALREQAAAWSISRLLQFHQMLDYTEPGDEVRDR